MKRSVRNLIAYIIVMVFMAQFLVFTPVTAADEKLSGTAFGTGPAYTVGHEYDKATDGNIDTYFDDTNASGGYTGIDLGAGNAKSISKIRFYPKVDQTGRMTGGKFQGSNTSTSSGYTDLYTIPPPTGWTGVVITNGTAFRYLRYLGTTNGLYQCGRNRILYQ